MLVRGDIVEIHAVNFKLYSQQDMFKFRERLRGIVIPHNEFFFFKEKGFFEDPQEEVELRQGNKLYDVVMPNGTTLENVGYQNPAHMIIYWANREVTSLVPLIKEVPTTSQTVQRALHWTVVGNRPPVWESGGYKM